MDAPVRKKRKLENCPENKSFYPILTKDLTEPIETISVYVDTIIDHKSISKVIVDLNRLFPLDELGHLKRINGKQVILFVVNENGENPRKILEEKHFNVTLLSNEIKQMQVAKSPAKTRKQYEEIKQLWPCNFHANQYIEKLSTNTLFTQEEIDLHLNFMKIAIATSTFSDQPAAVGVVIVDPKINSIVAVGYGETKDNPCKHAVMVAIDNVAKSQEGGAWKTKTTPTTSEPMGIPLHMRKLIDDFPQLKFGGRKFQTKDQLQSPTDGPYLCTDYDVYMTHECCLMCGMALVHSRAKRIFFGVNQNDGALETLCKIHEIHNLNHYFQPFGGLLRDEISSL